MVILKERHPQREFSPRTDCHYGADAAYYWFAAAAAAAAYSSYETGKAQKYQYQAQAEEAKTEARDKELQRRQRLLRAIAGRNVASAAGGTALEGTDIALVNRDFREYSLDSLTSEAMTKARVNSLRAAGKSAYRVGIGNATASLLSIGTMGKPPGLGGTTTAAGAGGSQSTGLGGVNGPH
jgi:hypothetical protein